MDRPTVQERLEELARERDLFREGVWEARPLEGAPYRHVMADALAPKVREDGRIVQAARWWPWA